MAKITAELTLKIPDESTLSDARHVAATSKDAKAVAVAKAPLDLVERLKNMKTVVERR
jgi:hypothetical protein